MTTIKDIANRLGISISTVSKGLNGASDISEELRQQVLDCAVEMGYAPKRTKKIGNRKLAVLIKNMEYEANDTFAYDLILGFRQQAFREKWDVEIIPVDSSLEDSEKYDTYLLKNGYSGAFVIGFMLEDTWIKQIYDTKVPTVLFDNFIPRNPHVAYIATDNFEGIETAVEYLVGKGHKNIAFLNGEPNSRVWNQRQMAFESTMTRLGVAVNDKLMIRSLSDATAGKLYTKQLVDTGASVILCGNDQIARSVYEECDALGLSVPKDISIIGFDDLPFAEKMIPPLTTVRQERLQLGKAAYTSVTSLVREIPMSQIIIRPTLIERSSVAGR